MRSRRFAFGAVTLMAALTVGSIIAAAESGASNQPTPAHAATKLQPSGPVVAPTMPTQPAPNTTATQPGTPTGTGTATGTASPATPSPTSPTASPSPSVSPSASPSMSGSPSPSPAVPGAPATGQIVVKVSTIQGKQVLTDGTGRALYLFTSDMSSTSTCTGSCATEFPPLIGHATAGTGVDAAQLSSARRPDSSLQQVTYHGHPLYFFSGDKTPGTANGQGVGGVWFLVNAQGTAVH